jgi:hypothetical protein
MVFLRAVVGLWGDAKAFWGKGESGFGGRPAGGARLDPTLQIRLFGKLKLENCARSRKLRRVFDFWVEGLVVYAQAAWLRAVRKRSSLYRDCNFNEPGVFPA